MALVVEYPGNGGANELGDAGDGTMEGCMMGYGLSEGRGFLWLCPPIVGQDQKLRFNGERYRKNQGLLCRCD